MEPGRKDASSTQSPTNSRHRRSRRRGPPGRSAGPQPSRGRGNYGAHDANELLLSAIQLNYGSTTFIGRVEDYDQVQFDGYMADDDLFVYRCRDGLHAGRMLVIPLAGDPSGFEELAVEEHKRPLAALTKFRLPVVLESLNLKRKRFSLERVKRNDDVVRAAFGRLRMDRPARLRGFQLNPRTRFEIRILERGDMPVLTVQSDLRRKVPDIGQLLERRVDLKGITVLRRREHERSLYLGEVTEQSEHTLRVDGPEGELSISKFDDVYIEPSTTTFVTLFRRVLGDNYDRYEQAEWDERSSRLAGHGAVQRLRTIAKHLVGRGTLRIAPGLNVRLGRLLGPRLNDRESAAYKLPNIVYRFAPGDSGSRSKIPSQGLNAFGPFDSQRFRRKTPRIMVIFPAEEHSRVQRFCDDLFDGIPGSKNFKRGLVGTYHLGSVLPQWVPVKLSGCPPHKVAERYRDAWREEFHPERPPDLALTVLRDCDAFARPFNPYIALKAQLLTQGIPTQNIRMLKVDAQRADRSYIAEDMALAMYAKLGGTPWTVEPPSPRVHEIVVGMGYTEVGGRHETKTRYAGITTVFSSDGAYVLAAKTPRCRLSDFARVFRQTTVNLIRRLKRDYGWVEGDVVRLIFHARRPLKGTDIAAIGRDAVGELDEGIRFEAAYLTITKDHPFTIYAPGVEGRSARVDVGLGRRDFRQVAECVPQRGTAVELGAREHLLCVSGHLLARRAGEPIPQPLLVTLHPDSQYRDMNALVTQVYQFTGLSWRSVRPTGEPVTIGYSRQIARRLAELDRLDVWNDQLLDTRLQNSRWFL